MERYQGLYPSQIRSAQRKQIFPTRCDIIFVTAQGVIRADEKIPPNDAPLTIQLAQGLRQKNLETMKKLLNAKKYDEIYVNVGRNYLESIEGFEKLTNTKISYATGVLGKKAVHMKQWIQEHAKGRPV